MVRIGDVLIGILQMRHWNVFGIPVAFLRITYGLGYRCAILCRQLKNAAAHHQDDAYDECPAPDAAPLGPFGMTDFIGF